MILSRECCEFISRSSEVERIKSFYRHTLIPDEGFFPTVLMNTNYSGSLVNDDKRAIVWIPDEGIRLRPRALTANDTESLMASGRIKLRPKTFTANDTEFLLASGALFARKFDMTVDSTILDILESRLQLSNYTPANKRLQPIALGFDARGG